MDKIERKLKKELSFNRMMAKDYAKKAEESEQLLERYKLQLKGE